MDGTPREHGRVDYLRLSITDRCNLRCTYCMPADGVEARDHSEILSYEELAAFARVGRRRRHHQGAHHRRRAARPPGLHRLRRHARAHQRYPRHLAHHQRLLLPRFAGELAASGLDARQHQPRQPRRRSGSRRITRGGRLEDSAGRHRRRLRGGVLAGQDQHAAAARCGGRARRVRRAHARVRRPRAVHRVHAAGPAHRRRRRAGRRGAPAAGRRRAAPAHAGVRARRPRRTVRARAGAVLAGRRRARHHRASSPACPSTSARPATACASPRTAVCAPACSPAGRSTSGRCWATRRSCAAPSRRRCAGKTFDRCSEALANERSMSQIGG